jgi:Domain of unknown function (DUF4402)
VGTRGKYRFGRKLALCLCALGTSAGAQAATQTGTAKAITLKPLSIVKLRDLDFGTLASGTTAGTVIINPNTDARTTSGGALAAGGTPQAAQFYTYATGNILLIITLGAPPTLARSGGGATMTMSNLTLNGPTIRLLPPAGIIDLRVGGTLAVGASQLDGTYAGNFDVTVTYF